MKFIIAFVIVVLNIFSYPINLLLMNVKKWYLPMWKKDKIIYFAFAPFYWILVALSFMFAFPIDLLSKMIH